MKKLIQLIFLFLVGGFIYFGAEMLIRQHSHWSMFICGGICFLLIGGINEFFDYDMSLLKQMFYSTIMITIVEFIFGCIFNLWLKLNIWDYSNQPLNLLGQVCPLFSILWFFVSLIGIVLDDFIRWKLFNEEKPHYKII